MNIFKLRLSLSALSMTVVSLIGSPAFGGSFQINEISAVDLGRANSGRTTQTDDSTGAYTNPALMTEFSELTLTNSISYIDGTGWFDDAGSVDLTGQPLGQSSDDFFDNAFVPALSLIYPVNDKLSIGLSVTAPYGLSSSYKENSVQRYQALESALLTVNINPSLAYALSDQLSIGGGVNIQYAKAELSSAIDFGAVCFAQQGANNCTILGLTPQSTDGVLALEGDAISFGYNVGVAFNPTDRLTFGAHYRSEVEHRLKGDAKFIVPMQAQILTATGAFVDTGWTAKLPNPAVWDVGAQWQINDQVMLSANINRTIWSQFETLDVEFDNPVQPPTGEDLQYKDANRYSLGIDYGLNSHWTLRAGVAFDETPQQADKPTARIPDGDRNTYAIGATYKGWEFAQLSIAYNRLDFDEAVFDKLGPTNDRLNGISDVKVNLLAVGITKAF